MPIVLHCLLAWALLVVSATTHVASQTFHPATCCSTEKKCCGQTFSPPKSYTCQEGKQCCDDECEFSPLETIIVRITRVERYAVDGLHLRRCHRRSRALFRGSATATGAISLRCPSSPRVARPGALQLPHARRQIAATSFTPTGVSADRTTETTAPAPPACRRVLFWHPRDPTRATPPDPRVPSIHLGLWHMRHRLFAPRQRVVTHVCARQAP